MRRLRLTLGYRGTRYAGWATQKRWPTVQDTVEAALQPALGHPVKVVAAGRTDTGVHADAQVITFDTSSTITPIGLREVLSHHLPDDIWVVDAAQPSPGFDARRSAQRRWYRYALWCSEAAPPAEWQGRCTPYSQPVNLRAMRTASRYLMGRHDFSSLVTRPSRRGSTERTVFAADWLEKTASLRLFEICADAYLKQMVRTIVGSLLWVGSGRWTPTDFANALEQKDRRAAGPTAPASGLTLHRIEY